jgi:ferritin-like metal-binding protein YciE
MSGYGTARTFAELLGEAEVVRLLQATLDEEEEAEERMTEVAESGLNQEAAGEDELAAAGGNGMRRQSGRS